MERRMYSSWQKTLRLIVHYCNDNNVEQGDIVSVLPSSEGYVILYYK